MDCVIVDNSLYLPVRTKFLIKYQSLVKRDINLKQFIGCNRNEFFAIFEKNDVDFEIWCDNRECNRVIRITFTINGKNKTFRVPPKKLSTFKALETNGRKLHFMSLNTEWGNRVVAQTSHKYGISYELASIICSRIDIRVQVGECVENIIEAPITTTDIICIGPKFSLFVKTLTGKTIVIEIGWNNTVRHLKMIIAKRIAIPPNLQQVVWAGKPLKDDLQISDYSISHYSTIHLTGSLFGGKQLSRVNYYNTDSDTTYSSDEISSPQPPDNISIYGNHGSSQLFSDDRGVVCFGERSDKVFGYVDSEFIADPNIIVNPFVIELRIDPIIAALI